MVGIDHNHTCPTLLPHVGPRVTTAPVVTTFWTPKLSEHPVLALVGGFLLRVVQAQILCNIYSHSNANKYTCELIFQWNWQEAYFVIYSIRPSCIHSP